MVVGIAVVILLGALTRYFDTHVPQWAADTPFNRVAKSIEFPVSAIAIGLICPASVAPAQGGAAETGSTRASSAHEKLMIRSRHWMSKVTENVLGVMASTVVSNRRIVMELGAEAVRTRRRARKLLIAVGDVVGVLVLIGAVFVLGSHGGALEALLSFKMH